MYERFKICPKLGPKEKCFQVQRYHEGNTSEVFHEHIPAHRITADFEMEVLRTFIAHFAEWSAEYILHSHLNNRRGIPSKYPPFLFHAAYPEAGVLRRYLSSGNVTAWADTVVLPAAFRPKKRAPNQAL